MATIEEDTSNPTSHDAFKRVTSTSTSVWRSLTLQTTVWEPVAPAKAIVYVSHGVGEHMGRYEELGQHLATSGILMFGHDHVGHGNSGGDRVHIENYDVYVQDVIKSIETMKTTYSTLPCFLMGHSMGGLIAGLVAVERQDIFSALILSSAVVEIDPKAAGWFVQLLAKTVAVFAPQLGIKTVNTEDVSSVPEEVQRYVDDPLNYLGPMKAKWGAATLSAISEFRQNAGVIQLPILLIHGTEDRLVPISASEFIVDNVSSTDIQFEKFENNRHEVFHDVEQERARNTVSDWILKHIQPCD